MVPISFYAPERQIRWLALAAVPWCNPVAGTTLIVEPSMPTDIVLSLNSGLLRPLMALMNSIVSNSSNPASLRFNLLVPPVAADVAAFEQAIAGAFPDRSFEARVAGTELSDPIRNYIEGRLKTPLEPDSGKAMNYARFEMLNQFPDIEEFIYLDADIIVLSDIGEVFAQIDPSLKLAAVRQPLPGITYFRRLKAGWQEGMSIPRPFNAGVYVSHGRHWGEGLHEALGKIMDWDREQDFELFWLHTEPLMNLLFKDYQVLPKRWNNSGFGNHPLVARLLQGSLSETAVIHWSGGHRKPWKNRDTAHADTWWKYDLGPVG